MAKQRVYNFAGLNNKQSPLLHDVGELLYCKNLTTTIRGAKTKRNGYSLLGTLAGGGNVTSLYTWVNNAGTKQYHAYANNLLYRSTTGTSWSQVTYGTFGGTIGTADPKWATMGSQTFVAAGSQLLYTNDGTTFGTIALAPTSPVDLLVYRQRLFVGAGTILYASVLGTPDNWSLAVENPSFSEPMEGKGRISGLFVNNDEIIINQTYGDIIHYDGYRKYQSPSSDGVGYKYSIGNVKGVTFYSNNNSIYGFTTEPQRIGEIIDPLYLSSSATDSDTDYYTNTGAIGAGYRDKYYLYLGSVSNPTYENPVFLGRAESNLSVIYDVDYNEWETMTTYDPITSLYNDNGVYSKGLMFGSSSGQVFMFDSSYSDNGQPIECEMIGYLGLQEPDRDKLVKRIVAHASPGCGAKFQVAMGDDFDYEKLQWTDIGDLYGGIRKWQAPDGLRGKYLFYRLYESSTNKSFTFYGFTVIFDYVGE